MRNALLFVLIAALSSCVAETVERRKPRKGPVKEVGFVDMGGGHVRYSTDGWGWFVSGRRRDALRKMRKNCGKELAPQVTDDYHRQDTDISYSGEDVTTNLDKGMEHFKIAPFQHLTYDCKPKGAKHEVPVSTGPARVILVVPPTASTAAAPSPEPVPVPAPEPPLELAPTSVQSVSTAPATAPAQEPPR